MQSSAEPGAAGVVLVPVKSFALAKARLAPLLSTDARQCLARALADRVLVATVAAGLEVHVVCDHNGVAEWAEAAGAKVAWTPGLGLNGALNRAALDATIGGAEWIAVVHADLPKASASAIAEVFATALRGDAVVGVPDRRSDGTNVLCVPAGRGFAFAYGPGSFARHRAQSIRLGLGFVELEGPLTFDVDVPSDLDALDTDLRKVAGLEAARTCS